MRFRSGSLLILVLLPATVTLAQIDTGLLRVPSLESEPYKIERSLYRDFPIREKLKGQLRLDFMNPFK